MNLQASIEQVAGILHRAGFDFDTHRDGWSYRIRFDRDAVFVHVDDFNGSPRVFVSSPALSNLDPEDPGYALLLNQLNELNAQHRFAKWFITDGTLLCAHDLLGSTLQADQLLNAVMSVAGAVHNACEDRELEDVTGGDRYDVDELAMSEVEDD